MNLAIVSSGLVVVAGLFLGGCAPTHTSSGALAANHATAMGFGSDVTPAEGSTSWRSAREAEREACVEVPEADRDGGPFAQKDRVAYVEEVRDRLYPKQMPQTFGIAVYVRATPGLTEQWLGRIIQCHQAHASLLGVDSTKDPLLGAGTHINIASTSTGFRVTILSPDLDVARALLESGRSLASIAAADGTVRQASTETGVAHRDVN